MGEAPLNFVYEADYAKMASTPDAAKILYRAADTGFIARNVYHGASEGPAPVVRAGSTAKALAKAAQLPPARKITLAQTVGYPKRAQSSDTHDGAGRR